MTAVDSGRLAAETRCRVCGGDTIFSFLARDLNVTRAPAQFPYRRCGTCRSLTLSSPPANLDAYYPRSYYTAYVGQEPTTASVRQLGEAERFKLDLIAPHARSGRLVEVGPAGGVFASLAQSAGFHVVALERDESSCAFLKGALGIETHLTDRPELALADLPTSDVIAMFHVIEHVPAPACLLTAAARNLRPGGVLVVATPNADSPSLRLLGRHWGALEAPRHLAILSLDGLDRVLQPEGLRRLHTTCDDPISRETDAFVWTRLAQRFAARFVPSAQRGRATHYLRLAIAAVARPVEARPLNGTSFTAVYVMTHTP